MPGGGENENRAGGLGSLLRVFRPERIDELHGFDADAGDLADEADDVLFIVGVVGVAGDAAAFVGALLVLVDDPIECAAVAEAVVEDLGRARCDEND